MAREAKRAATRTCHHFHASFTNSTGAATSSGQTQIRATQTNDAGSSIDNWQMTLKKQNIASGKLHRTIQLQLTLLEAISVLHGKGMAVASLAASADKPKVTLLRINQRMKMEIQQPLLEKEKEKVKERAKKGKKGQPKEQQ